MGKQSLIDIAIILVLPLLIFGGYYYWNSEDKLLSFEYGEDAATPGGVGKLGEKTTVALAMLQSITLDTSVFEDPAYLSLRDYPVVIGTTTLGRPYPFVPPLEIRELLRRAELGMAPPAISPTQKLDSLQKKL